MITAEIKLHAEPSNVTIINQYTTYEKPTHIATQNILPFNNTGMFFSQFELNTEQARAFNKGIRIGTKWRVKGSFITIIVVGWNILSGKHEVIDGKPAIIKGRRQSPVDTKNALEFNYSVDEFDEMELVND